MLAAVDFVNENFEFETLAAFGVDELGSMTKRTIAGFSPRAAVIFQWIVTVVAGRGLRRFRRPS